MRTPEMNEIFPLIRKGAAVFTVNTRLSRYIRKEYDLYMKDAGLFAWPTPEILPLSSWALSLYESSNPNGPLLNGMRAEALWEKIVSKDQLAGSAVSNRLSDDAFSAYKLIIDYRVRLPEEIYLTEEAKALKRWIGSYENELKKLGFVNGFLICDLVRQLIEKEIVKLPPEIILLGFDEITPSAKSLLDEIRKKGITVRMEEDGDDNPDILKNFTVRACEDEKEEVVQAARWARSVYSPGKKIGVIVPALGSYRELIEKEFASELDPASVTGYGRGTPVFNISLGLPLSEEPLVRSALEILSIGEGKEELKKVSSILRSPYFALNQTDYFSLSKLDAKLKEDNRLYVSLYELSARTRGAGLEERFTDWMKSLKEDGRKGLPGYWAERFDKLLRNIRWRKGVKLSSGEFQALAAWGRLLESFSALDDILGTIGRREAVNKLSSLAASVIHQKETPDCPVQVMGVLESASQRFDNVWIMGCHEYAVPAEPSPNPFIPVSVQKRYGLPHSTHERELLFAKKYLKRVFDSAESFEVSYPLSSDNRELHLSPLLRDADLREGIKAVGDFRHKTAIFKAGALEVMPEEKNIPVGAEELLTIRGGTEIIKNQSHCPFKAFATHRLKAVVLQEPELGLSPSERGKILHKLLKAFWDDLGGSKGLKEAKESNRLESLIKGLVDDAFKSVNIAPPLSSRFVEIEKERFSSLLRDWADAESQRADFSVKASELEVKLDIGGLTIKGRIDRVDTLADGNDAIIDYKSGSANRGEWFMERPGEPQLLIYSTSGSFSAVSFAMVKPGECRFVGVASVEGAIPGVGAIDDKIKEKVGEVDWEGLLKFWREAVEGLAKEFLSGFLDVDPNEGLKGQRSPCYYCEIKPLCRITDVHRFEEAEE